MKMIAMAAAGLIAASAVTPTPAEAQRGYGWNDGRGWDRGHHRGWDRRHWNRGWRGDRGWNRGGWNRGWDRGWRGNRVRCVWVRGFYGPERRCYR